MVLWAAAFGRRITGGPLVASSRRIPPADAPSRTGGLAGAEGGALGAPTSKRSSSGEPSDACATTRRSSCSTASALRARPCTAAHSPTHCCAASTAGLPPSGAPAGGGLSSRATSSTRNRASAASTRSLAADVRLGALSMLAADSTRGQGGALGHDTTGQGGGAGHATHWGMTGPGQAAHGGGGAGHDAHGDGKAGTLLASGQGNDDTQGGIAGHLRQYRSDSLNLRLSRVPPDCANSPAQAHGGHDDGSSHAPRRTPALGDTPGFCHGSAPEVVNVAITGQPMATHKTAGTTTKMARNRFF